MIDFENLRGQWEKTSRVEHGYTQVDTRPLDCHVGYDEKFRRTLLIIGNVKTKIPPSSLSVEIKQWQRKDGKFSLALSLLSEDEAAVFFEMCRDLPEFAEEATDESQALKKFWQRYDHWQKLFVAAKKDLLTPEQQRGLIGELLFLRKQILDGRPLAESVGGRLRDEADNSIALFVVYHGDDTASMDKTLAEIYNEHGSRLLEGNVRSFLSTKRAVNKNIRKTILNLPEKFFAFNNGIAATAKQVEVKNFGGGTFITKLTDFQIINGGQTTAVILYARLKDKVSLEKIFVQMKLTRIGEMTSDEQEKLIGEISKSSNSQNKVSDADFFSTHPFHIAMEKISRRIFAPSGGIKIQTHWFYERARGQYVQEQMKMTPAQQKKFQLENPKSQVMTKTDFAKFRMSRQEHPDIVSKGAQTNFAKFADEISSEWKNNPAQIPAPFQCEKLFRLLERLEENGLTYESDLVP